MHSLFYHPILFCRNLIFLLKILADFQTRVDPLHLIQYFTPNWLIILRSMPEISLPVVMHVYTLVIDSFYTF